MAERWRSWALRSCGGASGTFFFFFNDTATTEIYTLSLHDALPISARVEVHDPVGIGPRLVGAPDPVHRPPGLEERRRGVQPEREPRGAVGREPAKPCGIEGLRVLGVQRAVDRPL